MPARGISRFNSSFMRIGFVSSNAIERMARMLRRCARSDLLAVLVLAAVFATPGLVGHDPWKADEPYVFGMVESVLETGDWVVPRVAGEPFMEKPPLYAVTGALFGRLFAPWLPLHDGARLATGFFLMVACIAVGVAARRWWGRGTGRFAVLALLGNLGLAWHAHAMLPDVPVLTGCALAVCGFAYLPRRVLPAGLLIGTGAGVGFLAKGLFLPGALGCIAILLPLLFRGWRHRNYFMALAIAAFAAAPWLLVWPLALHARSPELFDEWFWMNNVGRFTGSSVPLLGAVHMPGQWLRTIPWFTFPALPLACITCWRGRREAAAAAPVQFCVLASVVVMGVLAISASAREGYALPLLVPLSILAAPAAPTLPARIDSWWAAGSLALFGSLCAAAWAVWMTVMLSNDASQALGGALPLDFFRSPVHGVSVAWAVALTMLVMFLAWLHRLPARGLFAWVAGLSLCWGLLMSLWLPWLDSAKSYRAMFVSMGAAMPRSSCLASRRMGESERAMLHYVLHVDTRRHEVDAHAASACDLLLVQGFAKAPPEEARSSQWRQLWDGARPADRRERFWLLARSSG